MAIGLRRVSVGTVLGVDPGTAATGYGLVTGRPDGSLALVECGVVRTTPRTTLAVRLRTIFEGLSEVLDRHQPDVVAVEDIYYGRNVRTAMVLGHARGAILLAAALRDIEVSEYSPSEVKSAVVGAGRATKDQVGFMVQRLLRLKSPPRPDDAADGVAVALCHAFRGRLPAAALGGSAR